MTQDLVLQHAGDHSQPNASEPLLTPVAALSDNDALANAIMHELSDEENTAIDAVIDRQGFHIGSIAVMIEFIDGSELTDLPKTYRLPNTPEWFKGYSNLHGNLIPVFDLKEYFNINDADETLSITSHKVDKKLLVLLHGDDAAGVIIDSIPKRLKLNTQYATNTDIAPEAMQPHILNAYKQDDEVWFDLNVFSLLDTIEQDIQS